MDNDFATCRVSTRCGTMLIDDQNSQQILLNRAGCWLKECAGRTCASSFAYRLISTGVAEVAKSAVLRACFVHNAGARNTGSGNYPPFSHRRWAVQIFFATRLCADWSLKKDSYYGVVSNNMNLKLETKIYAKKYIRIIWYFNRRYIFYVINF